MARRRMGIWVFVLVAVVIVAIALYSESLRRQSLGRAAEGLGLAFNGVLQPLPAEMDAAGFYLFTQGPPEVLNLMRGQHRGYEVALFGFGYDAPQGEEGSRDVPVADAGQVERRLQTVIWAKAPDRSLPDFDLSPALGSLRRVAQRFGMLPVSIDWRADLRDRYLLLARDPAALKAVLTPAVLDALVADPGWFVEGRGNQWLLYRVKERVPAGEIGAFLDRGLALLNLLREGGRSSVMRLRWP